MSFLALFSSILFKTFSLIFLSEFRGFLVCMCATLISARKQHNLASQKLSGRYSLVSVL